jgi:hypothetical protein
MKNKILSVLGVITVVTSLIAISGVTQVSAGTQSWTSIPAPATSSSTEWVGPIAKAVDGTLYTSAGQYNGKNDGTQGDFIYKSTDFGRSWIKTTTQPSETTGTGLPIPFPATNTTSGGLPATQMNIITDIQCPGTDGNTVYVTDGYDIFKSVNGGVTWSADVNLFNAGVNAHGTIVSISIGYIGTNAYVFAGTTTWGGGGDVFVLQESVYNNPWADLNVGSNRPTTSNVPNEDFSLNCDVTKVQVDPAFATTQMVMAVVTDYTNHVTRVTTKYGSLEWDTTANDILLKNTIYGAPNTNNTDPVLLASSIYLPSDFTSNVASGNMVAFVGTDVMPFSSTENPTYGAGNGFGDVYLCYFGPAPATTPNPTNAFDLNVAGQNTAFNVSGMSGVGTAAGADIMVSGYTNQASGSFAGYPNGTPLVYVTKNGGVTWTAAAKEPTGGVSQLTEVLPAWAPLCSVMVKSDFASSGTAIVGTEGTDCGLSGTTDFGNTFNTLSPNTSVAGAVNFTSTNVTGVSKISLATDGTIYETSYSSGSGATATAAVNGSGTITGLTLVTFGVQFVNGETVNLTQTGSSNTATATVTTDGFGHLTGITVAIAGTGYTTAAGKIVIAGTTQRYSAWRYSPTNLSWDRINSWSLYAVYTLASPPVYTNPVAFNLIATTPAQDAVFISNNANNQLYRSIDKGQTWTQWGQQVPTTSGAIDSWLVINPSTVLIGAIGNGSTTGGVIWTTTNGAVWIQRQAFKNTSVAVTDIRLAPNGDYLAAGRDSAGDINVAKSSSSGVTWTSDDHSGLTVASTAYIGAAADYATSGIVYYTGDSAGIYYSTITGATTPPTPIRADNSNAYAQSASASGLITSPGGPGFAAEGTGMAYATVTGTSSTSGVVRVRGRVDTTVLTSVAELIPDPISNNASVAVAGLYVSTSSVGNVTLFAVGTDNKIYSYTDTLNGAVAGVAASNVTTANTGILNVTTPSSATIQWTAVPNATNYFVIIDNTAAWTNLYLAEANIGAPTVAASAVVSTNSVTFTQKFTPTITYYVSVWALKNNTLGTANPVTLTLTTVTSLMGTNVISTFGGTVTFNPPLQVPITPMNLVPVLGSTISPVSPNFDWQSVTGATSYTLQLTTASDAGFASPVYVNSTIPVNSGPTVSFTYTGTLSYNTSYIWRVMANGTTNSTWVYGNFYTALVVTPPVTVSVAPVPTIIITQQPAVTITQAAPVPTPVYTLPQATILIQQPTAQTPTYIWIIVGVGALLTLAVIILIIRTRRVV